MSEIGAASRDALILDSGIISKALPAGSAELTE